MQQAIISQLSQSLQQARGIMKIASKTHATSQTEEQEIIQPNVGQKRRRVQDQN